MVFGNFPRHQIRHSYGVGATVVHTAQESSVQRLLLMRPMQAKLSKASITRLVPLSHR